MDIDPKKPSILLMHGSGLTHIVWSLHEQFYSANGFNVLSIDLPGHGNSEGPCLDSIEKIVDWLEKVFKELKLNNLILVGHSQGCLVALEYTNKFPKKIKNLIFVAGSYEIPVNKSLIDLAHSGDMESLNLMMKMK